MRGVLIVSLTLVFIFLLYYAFQFTMNPLTSLRGAEGFATAPTRATDCNCLPGYIPSSSSKGHGGNVLIYMEGGRSYYLYNPSGTSDFYWIVGNDTCGLPTSGDFPKKTWDTLFGAQRTYTYKGLLTCSVVTKNTNPQPTFFCQNLSDSSRTKPCY